MAISKLVDDRKYEKKTVETCQKNSSDCMYLDKSNGTCRAEWCVFKELPEMIKTNVKLSCRICGKSKIVSVYSGETQYVCDNCIDRIRRLLYYYE